MFVSRNCIREREQEGEAVGRAREERRGNRGGRSAEEIRALRWEAARTAECCLCNYAQLPGKLLLADPGRAKTPSDDRCSEEGN
jgi:hypothetical protein